MANGQQELLSLIGISSPGSDVLFDGSAIAAGYHLRWSFLPELGFPREGFKIERRLYSGDNVIPQEWQTLTQLRLPRLLGRESNEELAAARITLFERVTTSRSANFAEHYLANANEFISLIISLQNPENLTSEFITGSRSPRTQLSTLDLILMASLDPYVARILGLYYVDSSIIPGTPVDYKVTGLWELQSWPKYSVFLNQSLDYSLIRSISTGFFSIEEIDFFSEFAASIAEQQNANRLRLEGAGSLSLRLSFPQTVREVHVTFSERIDSDDWTIQATTENGENISRINLSFMGSRVRIQTFEPCKHVQFTAEWPVSEIRVYHLHQIEYQHLVEPVEPIENPYQIIRFNPLPGPRVPESEYLNMPDSSALATPQVESLRGMNLPSRLNENGQVVTGVNDVELLCRQPTPEENEPNPGQTVRLHIGYRSGVDSAFPFSDVLTTADPLPWPVPKLIAFWPLNGSLRSANNRFTLVSKGETAFADSRFPGTSSLSYIDRREQTLELYTFPNHPSNPRNRPGYLELSIVSDLNQLGTHLYLQLWVLPVDSPQEYPTLIGNNYLESFWLGLVKRSGVYSIRFYVNGGEQFDTNRTIPVNEWSQVAVRYDGEKVSFYINGRETDSFEARKGKISPNSRNSLCIGCDSPSSPDDFSFPFSGYMADVQIWTSTYPKPSTENPNHLAGWSLDGNTNELKTDLPTNIVGTPIYEQDHPQNRDQQVLTLDGNTFLELRDRSELYEPNLPLTFQAWIKPDKEQNRPMLIGNNWFQSYWLGLRADGGMYRLTLRINDQRYESDRVIAAEYWSHITVSIDRQKIVFYINGKHSNTETVNITRIAPNPDLFFCIGADARSEPIRLRNTYRGKLADVHIWNSVPSAPSPALIVDKVETRAEQLDTPVFQRKFGELRAAWRLDGGLADTKTGRYLATKIGRLGYEIGHPQNSQRRVLKLNGTNMVQVVNQPLEFYSFGNELTLRAWVNPNSFNSEVPESRIMTIISNDRTTSFALGLEWVTAGYRLWLSINGRDFRSRREIPSGQWSRLQVSYDGQQIVFQAQDINARTLLLESLVARLDLLQANRKRVLRIGSELSEEVFQVERAFRGKLADVEIWNRLPEDREDPKNTIPDDLSDLILPADYIAHQMPDGTYNFWAQGIDIFGRVSSRSSHRRITLSNRRKPPAPGATKASFLPLMGKISAVEPVQSESDSSSLAELIVEVTIAEMDLGRIPAMQLGRRYGLTDSYVLDGGYDIEVISPRLEEPGYVDIESFEIDEILSGDNRFTVVVPPFSRLGAGDVGKQITIAYDYHLRVSWSWTGTQRLFYPDVNKFNIYQKLANQTTWPSSIDTEVSVEQTVIEPNNISVPLIPQEVSPSEWEHLQGNNPEQGGVRWLPEPLDSTNTSTDKKRTSSARLLKVRLPNQTALEETSDLMPVQSATVETFVSGALVAYDESEGAQTWLHYQVLWHEWNEEDGWILYFVQPQPGKQNISDDGSTGTSGEEPPLPRLRYARYYPGQRYITQVTLNDFPNFRSGLQTLGTIPYEIGITAVVTRGDDVLESEIGVVASVVAVNRRRPPLPPRPEVSIDRADYYGKSRATVFWNGLGAGVSYQLYRAVDSAIAVRDLEQRRLSQPQVLEQSGLSQSQISEIQRLNPGYVGMSPEEVFDPNPTEWAFEEWLRTTFNFKQFVGRPLRTQWRALVDNWQTQLFVPKPPDLGRDESPTPAHIAWQLATEVWQAWAERFYSALIDREFVAVAQRRGNETAFSLVNSAPIEDMTLERDLENRRLRTGPYKDFSSEKVFDDDRNFVNWLRLNFSDFFDNWQTSLFVNRSDREAWERASRVWESWAERFYSSLAEEQLIELGREEGNKTRYADTVNGTVRNRYLYRLRTQTKALLQSAGWGPVSKPQQAPQTRPPRSPVFTKVEPGDRQITLHWALNREPDFKEYRLYRVMMSQQEIDRAIATAPPEERETPQQQEVIRRRVMAAKKSELEDLRWWEDDLPNKRMRVISDPRIVVQSSSIRLPGNLPIAEILGVFDINDFDLTVSPPSRQEFALNYYNPSSSDPSVQASVFTPSSNGEVEHQIDHLRKVADGKALAVVYRDRERNVRYAVRQHSRVPFADREASELSYYYYRLSAVNEPDYPSPPSKIVMAMPIEGSPPEPIAIQELSWQPVSGELSLRITWIAQEGLEVQILRKNSKSNHWKVIQDWMDASAGSFIEMNSEPYFDNEVIMKTRRIGGRLTSDSAIEAIAAYPY